jgi:acyl-CoA synthetase (NDP forming)
MPTTRDALDALFHPRAAAAIGASDDDTKHGYIVLNNLRDTGFRGGIYGISRRLQQVNGIPCFPDLASVPEPVDVAFLAIPAEAAVQAVRDCARAASAGNEADLSVLDYMEYAITHEPTKVIALLIDSLPDGRRFRALALRAHAAGKPVVALKIGGSEAGAAAAVAHSSRLAGDAQAYRALFDASGVAVVATLEGLLTASALLARYGRRPGRLGALSTSGAGASIEAESIGFPVVVKKVVDGVAHKSDLGLVHTGLTNGPDVLRAVEEMGGGTVLVQAMIKGDLEAIAGVTRRGRRSRAARRSWRHLRRSDKGCDQWPIPIDRETIERGLHASTLGRVLHSPRWKHPAASTSFVDLLLALQAAAVSLGDRLHAIDVNPVILGAQGAIAVDALVIPVS